MQKIRLFLALKAVRATLTVLIVCGLLWFLLPLFSYFKPLWHRIPTILTFAFCIVLLFFVSHLFQQKKEKNSDAIREHENKKQAERNKPTEIEKQKQREKLKNTISLLKRRGVKNLYDLPWFLLIGPSNAGKTTFLRQSGLQFPLEQNEIAPLKTNNKTELCDWWFNDEAVFIDTAGRYTTQDSDISVDHVGWFSFLHGLKKTRERQPINGVIILLSLEEILSNTREVSAQHANKIRQRIEEIVDKLSVNIPIYVIFNKSDQVSGFEEFFKDLNAESRQQVWGITFPLEEKKQNFKTEFDLILEALYARQLDRMQSERRPEQRAAIFSFPTEMSSLSNLLNDFLQTIFYPLSQQENVLWRGVYFTSAAQTGSAFDQLSGALSQTFGIEQKYLPTKLKSSYSQAYFIFNLVNKIILGGASLGTYTPQRYRKRRLLRFISLAVLASFGALISFWLWHSEYESSQSIKKQLNRFSSFHDTVAPVTTSRIRNDDDLPQICAILNASQNLSQREGNNFSVFRRRTDHVETQTSNSVYQNTLQKVFFPRLLWRIEQEIRQHPKDPIFLYDSVSAYLILAGQGPTKPAFVQSWFTSQWQRQYPGIFNSELRQCLGKHLTALVSSTLPKADLNDGLIARARIAFSHITPAERIYANLRHQPIPKDLTGWHLEDVFEKDGVNIAPLLFKIEKKSPTSEGIPPFFTGDGFNKILRKNLPLVANEIAQERWVTGQSTNISLPNNILFLEQKVGELWRKDANEKWDTLLNDLHLRLSNQRSELSNQLYLLSSSTSPLGEVVSSIANAQKIPELPGLEKLPTEPLEKMVKQWNLSKAPLEKLTTPSGNSPSLMDELNKKIAKLGELTSDGSNVASLNDGQLTSPIHLLALETVRFPKPVSNWITEITTTTHQALYNHEVQAVKKDFNLQKSGLGQACHQITENRFPFARQSEKDISLQNFVRLFGPNGLMDKYFQEHMAHYVNQTGLHWKPKEGEAFKTPYNQSQITSFEQASKIRDVFFQNGANPSFTANLSFNSSSKTVLRLGSLTLKSGDKATFNWPDSDKSAYGFFLKSKIRKIDARPLNSGAWAFFRLLSQGDIQSQDIEGVTYHFLAGETLRINSQAFKEMIGALNDFKCPKIY